MLPRPIIHLLSGGLDSTVLLYDLHNKHPVHCLLFDYKQRHVQELQFAKHHCGKLGVLYTVMEVPQLKGSQLTDGEGSIVVPNRNAILLSLAVNVAVKAGAETVTFAANKDDEALFPDCRMAFVQAFNIMLIAAEIHVEVCAPYHDKPKWAVADLGRQLGVDMAQTWSCYAGGAKPCGKCEACRKRKEALNHK